MAQVLVSVRDLCEAQSVARCDVGIIDIKEPLNGPLGMAGLDELSQIAFHANEFERPVSLALGESSEHSRNSIRELAPLLSKFQFAKFGLAHSVTPGQDKKWASHWSQLIDGLPPQTSGVAVAYADWETCRAPHPIQVLEVGIECGCKAFLLDTFNKNPGKDVFSWIEENEIENCFEFARSQGMTIVLAGSIRHENIEKARRIEPDFIGVRGAVCNESRSSTIDINKLKSFVHQAAIIDHNASFETE